MLPLLPILADSSPIFGFLVFLIVAAIAIVSSIAKKQEEERRRKLREQIFHDQAMRGQAPLPPPLPQPRQRPAVVVRRQLPIPPVPRMGKRMPKRSAPARQAPPPRMVLTPPPAIPVAAPVEPIAPRAQAPTRPIERRPATATAPALAQWLRPGTLRAQFILTEILRPPLSLRDESSSRPEDFR